MKNRIRKLSGILSAGKMSFEKAAKNAAAFLVVSAALLFSACQNSSSLDDGFFCIVQGNVYSKDSPEISSSESFSEASARFAFPDIEISSLHHVVTGTKYGTGETADGEFSSDSSGTQSDTFTIRLTEGTWTLDASAYNNSSSAQADKEKDENKVLEGSVTITVTKENPVMQASIPLSPYYGPGDSSGTKPTGNISLEISIDSSTSIKGVKTEWNYLDGGSVGSGSGTITGVPQGKSFDVSSSGANHNLKIEETDVPVGSYKLSLYFFSSYESSSNSATGTLLYYAQEDVNVLNGQTTSGWKGNSPYFKKNDGKTSFSVTSAVIKDFRDTVYYVCGTGGYSPAEAASDSNQGTYFDPFQSFTKAAERIKERQKSASSAMTYTVYVSGKVKSTANFSDFFTDSSSLSATVNIKAFSGGTADTTTGKKGTLESNDGTAGKTITTGSLTGKTLYLNFKDLALSGSGSQNGSVINIESGVKVNFSNVSVSATTASTKGTVFVNSAESDAFSVDGTVTIDKGSYNSKKKNVYLKSGAKIKVGSKFASSSKIGVTAEDDPANQTSKTVDIATLNSSTSSLHSCFTSDDDYAVKESSSAVQIAVSSGSFTVKAQPVVKIVFADIDKICDTSKTKATIKKSQIGTGSGKYSKIGVCSSGIENKVPDKNSVDVWNMEIYYHGIKVNTTAANTSSSSGTTSVNLDSAWPSGSYQVLATATYDGMTYSAVLELTITDD